MKNHAFSNLGIDNLSFEEALSEIKNIIEKKKGYIVTPNAAHIVLIEKDREFKEIYDNASLVLADGVPIIWCSKLLGQPLKEKCSGSDLFEEICRIAFALNKNIFLLGGANGSERIACEKLRMIFPGIKVKSYNPEFGFENNQGQTNAIINIINEFKTDVLFVFVGTPKSEKWIYRNINKINISIACPFGAALSYFAGTVKRSPFWMQECGLEWFWRLMNEPDRLWKRYLIGNIYFLGIVLKECVKRMKHR
jgi:exopolysaccharide biosynthesis WecB/TagA/CpsF family protein